MSVRCFACDRELRIAYEVTVFEEPSSCVYVGAECYRQILKAERAALRANDRSWRGWQPKKGGPKLGLIGTGSDPISVNKLSSVASR